jgi:excisionase family DNA binding protein
MNDMITPKEAAEILGVNIQTVRNYFRKNILKAIQIGARYRVDRQSVIDLALNGNPTAKNDRNNND